MEPLNVEKDFLEALQHHPYFLSEFLIHKQQKSGWSKAAYLKAMEGELSRHKLVLHLLKNKAKVKTPDIDASLIGKPLDELTEGRVKEYFTIRTQSKTPLLNADVLDTFKFYLKKAWTFGEPEPVYSNLQIISFAVYALGFILEEFRVQAGVKESGVFFRNPPKGFKPTTTDGQPVHLIHNYLVAMPAPVFDYHLFADRFRELLLNSRHPEKLTKLATTLYKMSQEIVNLWNENLSPLEDISDETVVKTNRPISFNTEKRNFTIYHDLHPFVWDDNKLFTNYQLTVYASNVGHLVATEILDNKDEIPEINNVDKWDNSTYLLYYYHIAKSEGRELSETKVEQIAKEHNLTKGKLRQKLTELIESNFTYKNHTNSKTQFRKDLQLILPHLEEKYPNAYIEVIKQLHILLTVHQPPKKS